LLIITRIVERRRLTSFVFPLSSHACVLPCACALFALGKPGRAARDLLALSSAFQRLGDDVAREMWIDAAAAFQRLDDSAYAGKTARRPRVLVARQR
jgi:hypothetical protein